MKRKIYIAIIAYFTTFLFGQAAQVVDTILETQEATLGQAAYLILTASDAIPENTDFETAFAELQKKNWLKNAGKAEDRLLLKHYAFLLMQAFEIQGGMMYRIYPCPRYAYRDLQFLSLIQGETDPDQPVSGIEMLKIIGRIDVLKGGKK